MTRWWRSHSVRVRLTLWYVAAMVVILGVYAAVVFAFVQRSASQTLDQQLRSDFSWAAAMVDQTPEGRITWYREEDTFGNEELPWLQVWSPDGLDLLFSNFEAQRRPIAESQTLAAHANNTIVVRVGTLSGELEDDGSPKLALSSQSNGDSSEPFGADGLLEALAKELKAETWDSEKETWVK